jgi:hypothetical protein
MVVVETSVDVDDVVVVDVLEVVVLPGIRTLVELWVANPNMSDTTDEAPVNENVMAGVN